MKKPCEIVASRDEAIHKMRAAADRNLSDMYTEQERQAWAERTADAYIKRGIIALQSCAEESA